MNVNIIDIIIVVPVLFGLFRGLYRGFVSELTSLVAVVAGVIGARIWAPGLSMQLGEMLALKPSVANLISYCLVFLAIALSLHLIGRLFTKFLSAISLGALNRLVGAIFGALKWALIVSILINGFDFLDKNYKILKPEIKKASICYQPMKQLASVAWDSVKEVEL